MKKLFAVLTALIAASLIVLLFGCESNSTYPLSEKALGVVTGSIQLNPDLQGSVAHTRIALYRSTEDYAMRVAAAVGEADANGNYVIAGVAPGRYYVDAWKDNDGNGGISRGDFYAIHCNAQGHLCNCCEPRKSMCCCWTLDIVQ